MAYESGSFCLPIARICVSFSTLASLNAEGDGITKQLMASVHRMAKVSTVVHRMARRPRHWRLVKARAPGNHCFLRCLPSVTSSTSVWRPQCGPTYIYRQHTGHSAVAHLHTLAQDCVEHLQMVEPPPVKTISLRDDCVPTFGIWISEKLQTAFDPPTPCPRFGKLCCAFSGTL